MLISCALGVITDLNCTIFRENKFEYAPTAFNCQNRLRDELCAQLYRTEVKLFADADRDNNCFKENCKKTCGFCNTVTTRSPGAGPCGSQSSCAQWVRNGFCTNSFYTIEQRRQYCGRQCGLC
ncbi:hypothetical protein KIN20_003288 [Parelaphostrongylus tenuis]|uniref:ShKT domain-containing protein n=1 Tax=Parelaphostrongylus tenuis TaxID=148309 RepID=A0AAD5QHC1_PARTN|nr:hypothetical protein KIN20_003288 [Parelaphostrongylus tenuis]